MNGAAFKPTYGQTLQNARHNACRDRVLSSLWRHPEKWPSSNSKMIFCAEAVERAGRMKFGNEWSGDEVKAYRYVHAFPDFAETVADFQRDLGGFVEMQSKYKRQYDTAKAKWDQFSIRNTDALNRLSWTCNWLTEKAREEHLQTFLRLVDSAERGAIYEPASEGLWNVEDVLETRFQDAGIGFGYDTEKKYIFFGMESFQSALRDIRIYEPPSSLEGTYLSPYMQLMLLAIEVHQITPEAPPKVESLQEWFKQEWRGIDDLSERHAEAMATFVRGPHRKEWQTRRKV